MTRLFLICLLLVACNIGLGQTHVAGKDTIRAKVFAAISGSRIEKISVKTMRLMGGMSFYVEISRYHWEPITVKSYRFTVIRNGEVIHTNVELTHKFGDLSTKFLNQLQPGDLLLFSEIKVPDNVLAVTEPWPAVFEVY
jgi:hypothetical protein